MERSKKTKTTQEDSPKGFPSDWKDIVLERNKPDFKFWEEAWNEKQLNALVAQLDRASAF